VLRGNWTCPLFSPRDVHTDVAQGKVLEVAVGRVNYCVAAVDLPESMRIYVGPVYSYYEFQHPAADRLTDGQWQAMLRQRPPRRPDFILPVVSRSDAALEPVVQAVREGNTLTITVDPRAQRGVVGTHRVEISAKGLQKLAQLAPGIRNLDASGLPITDAELAHLEPLTNLKAVDLSHTELTDRGLAHLAGSRFLRRLALKGTAITDAALPAMARWPYLETLDLRETQVSDAALDCLAEHRYLRQLMLEGTSVTTVGVETIRRAQPQCQVSRSTADPAAPR
jgi:hypothetical protein